ncbi:ABC transporter substrate-binding protein [Musicola paradisiaca]|uniref:Thiamine pyrimidine synthase n=1 Tax=Musicola paradisiaca (strain Ech703) TaxID=579405 RepID=C6C5P4_MUSP7|nr:ABC transporter substrate-binding protein [Musicola paradisiaca]ACS83857.1 NMT1/THI5 like domain protein [Musicola paradisiaca Ech703]
MTKRSVFRQGALLAALSLTFALQAQAAEKVTLQLKWVPQAQFAGYYVAQEKGFYKQEGLDVTIKPGGTDISPVQVIAGKSADVIVNWMPDALAAREAGVPLVNIAQVFDRSGMMLTCKKSSGVAAPADLKGKTLGVWFGGNEYPFFNWMNKLGYKPDVDIKVLKQGFNVDPLLQNQAACISTMNYNEYWQLIDAGVKKDDLITFAYEDQGVSTLEDGLYVLGPNLKDPAFVAKMAKFLKASFKGWNYAVNHPDEAAKIVVAEDASGAATQDVQQRQMENVAKLITHANTPKVGYLDPAAYRRTIDVLLKSGGSNPVIKKDPGDAAMSHVVWDAAMK